MHRQCSIEIPFVAPIELFEQLPIDRYATLLDAPLDSQLVQHAAIGFSPCLTLRAKTSGIRRTVHIDGVEESTRWNGDPWTVLNDELQRFRAERIDALPPIQCGAFGTLAYDFGLSSTACGGRIQKDNLRFDDLQIAFYDRVITFDIASRRAWVVSATTPLNRAFSAARISAEALARQVEAIAKNPAQKRALRPFPSLTLRGDFSRAQYEAAVQKVIDYIFAGDIFQANLSQRFIADLPQDFDSFELYKRLRTRSPSPFATYNRFDDTIIASASPERFIRIDRGKVETRPIKGTRPRGRDADEDVALKNELERSEKDRAENLMIVDLMRNDLSRVCRPHSIVASALFAVESYRTVHHLVSTIEGILQDGIGAVDVVRAAFPGGSITGAPKIRAMQILRELEPNSRGPYCGIFAYFGFDGTFDSSILIRTIAIKNSRAAFQVGGGIVADSTPKDEYEETLVKAAAMIDALTDDSD